MSDLLLSSDHKVDTILAVLKSSVLGNITIGSNTNGVFSYPTGIPESTLFDGKFEVAAIGISTPLGSQSYLPTATTPTDRSVLVNVAVLPGIINFQVFNSFLSAQTVTFEVVLIAKENQPDIAAANLVTDKSYTIDYNYLKIIQQNIVPTTTSPVNSPTFFLTTRLTIPNEGLAVNMYKVWMEFNDIVTFAGPLAQGLNGINVGVYPQIDPSNLLIDLIAVRGSSNEPARSVNIHYRIYEDD